MSEKSMDDGNMPHAGVSAAKNAGFGQVKANIGSGMPADRIGNTKLSDNKAEKNSFGAGAYSRGAFPSGEKDGRCGLCPRRCRLGALPNGFCGARRYDKAKSSVIVRAAPHYWEEPCISGTNGSGTVFFAGCNLGCAYCQNRSISRECRGRELTDRELAGVFLGLEKSGVHNINLVTPTHFSDRIFSALEIAYGLGLTLPAVYNTGSYELPEVICRMSRYVKIFLPDFKYYDDRPARRYSNAPDYAFYAKAAVTEMVKRTGKPVFDEDGMMKKGVIVRHLMLPGMEEDSRRVLRWLYDEFGDDIYISIMSQYTPPRDTPYQELAQKLDPDEYARLVDYADSIGITKAYIQDGEAASESFIPPFEEGNIVSPAMNETER